MSSEFSEDSPEYRLIAAIEKIRAIPSRREYFTTLLLETIRLDKHHQRSIKYSQPRKEQYENLKTIEQNCEALLDNLTSMQDSNRIPLGIRDFNTGLVIRKSAALLVRKRNLKHLNTLPQKNQEQLHQELTNSLAKIGEICSDVRNGKAPDPSGEMRENEERLESLPHDYPMALIDSIEKLREAVAHAAKRVKQGEEKISSKNPELIRKDKLTMDFIRHYQTCFILAPPQTAKQTKKKDFIFGIYEIFLETAGFAECDNETFYTKRIRKHKATIQKIIREGIE